MMAMTDDELEPITSRHLLERTGATYRQIDSWSRAHLLECAGSNVPGTGAVRRYAPDTPQLVKAIMVLSSFGVSGETLRLVVARLRSMDSWTGYAVVSNDGQVAFAPAPWAPRGEPGLLVLDLALLAQPAPLVEYEPMKGRWA